MDKLFDVCSTRYINIQRELAAGIQSEIIVVTNISINKQNLEKAIEENDAEKIHYYKVYYKGTFCRGLLMTLLLGIFAYSGFYLCIVFYFWRYYWC